MGKLLNRNVWCKHYDRCLDRAVETGQPFDCAGCEFEKNQDGRPEILDMFPVYSLLAAIFYPKIHKAYQKDKATMTLVDELEGLKAAVYRCKDKNNLKKILRNGNF